MPLCFWRKRSRLSDEESVPTTVEEHEEVIMPKAKNASGGDGVAGPSSKAPKVKAPIPKIYSDARGNTWQDHGDMNIDWDKPLRVEGEKVHRPDEDGGGVWIDENGNAVPRKLHKEPRRKGIGGLFRKKKHSVLPDPAAAQIAEGHGFLRQASDLMHQHRNSLGSGLGEADERWATLFTVAPVLKKLTKGRQEPEEFNENARTLLKDVEKRILEKHKRRGDADRVSIISCRKLSSPAGSIRPRRRRKGRFGMGGRASNIASSSHTSFMPLPTDLLHNTSTRYPKGLRPQWGGSASVADPSEPGSRMSAAGSLAGGPFGGGMSHAGGVRMMRGGNGYQPSRLRNGMTPPTIEEESTQVESVVPPRTRTASHAGRAAKQQPQQQTVRMVSQPPSTIPPPMPMPHPTSLMPGGGHSGKERSRAAPVHHSKAPTYSKGPTHSKAPTHSHAPTSSHAHGVYGVSSHHREEVPRVTVVPPTSVGQSSKEWLPQFTHPDPNEVKVLWMAPEEGHNPGRKDESRKARRKEEDRKRKEDERRWKEDERRRKDDARRKDDERRKEDERRRRDDERRHKDSDQKRKDDERRRREDDRRRKEEIYAEEDARRRRRKEREREEREYDEYDRRRREDRRRLEKYDERHRRVDERRGERRSERDRERDRERGGRERGYERGYGSSRRRRH
ncbi:hypothetical protein CYLTODRAFT_150112 [Cylindrobasidium torrendii FP15055 ss-10]|uniref:Uncharacterized protein n=1 Tax=Cylindrobasidium torrendii FP15055 ss-10 TaxID=1314674 RepID=A0A0D7AXG2_9AGAR|nr:hypothetical protein CYLTODRAFT_150112 [Cylindrobasidium torrendii FP15055 ss-10]